MKKVLKASAGTGKTYRLSLEYIADLLSGQDFTEIVVLTFTRKATAEARERILNHLQELEEKGKEAGVWQELKVNHQNVKYRPEVIKQCRQQMLLNKDGIHIYTIDSFTNQLFNKVVAPYLGVYNYEIMAEDKEQEIVSEVFRRLLQQEKYFSRLEEIFDIKVSRNYQNILNFIENIVENRWKYLLIENKKREEYTDTDFLTYFARCLEIVKTVADDKNAELMDLVVKDFEDAISGYENLQRNGAEKEELREFISGCRKLFLKEDKTFWSGNRVRGEPRDRARSEYQKFQSRLARYIFNLEVKPLENAIFELADAVFAEYDSLKMRRQKFTYSDISNYVYKYLVKEDLSLPGGSLSQFLAQMTGSEIKSLFIDEFQDTSILQWKILENFVDCQRDFIAVGDAKQSIYQWRGGEKELFVSLPQLLKSEEETLETCYRSDKNVVRFINDLFQNLHPKWDYDRVDPRPDAEEGYVEFLLGGGSAVISEETKKFQKLSEERQKEIRAQNQQVVENLRENIAIRLKEDFTSYKDVAVLARTNKELREIAGYLTEKGVPYVLHQEGNLLENKAVEPLYQLLIYLWQGDYHNLLNFLRSDLVQLPQEKLRFMLKNKSEINQLLDKSRRASAAESDLSSRQLLQEHKAPAEVLEWIIDLTRVKYDRLPYILVTESGAFSCWQHDRGSLKNLFRFYSLMSTKNSLEAFMEMCREEQGTNQLEEATVQEEDAVDLLTIHKSKGLSFHTEFFYWNLSGGRGGGSRKEELNLKLEFSSDYVRIKDYLLATSDYKNLLNWLDFDFTQEEKENLQEEINNVYVAMTRAKSNLFVLLDTPGQIKPGEQEAWKNNSDKYNFYESNLKTACKAESLAELIAGKSWGSFTQPKSVQETGALDLQEIGEYFQPSREIDRDSREILAQKKDINLNLQREVERMKGLAIHYYLEHIKYGEEKEKKSARRLTAARFGNILGDELTESAIEKAEKFLADNPRYFQERWQVFNEYEPVDISEKEEKGARIDRLMVDKENRKILILDYKTGVSKEKEQLERYKNLIAEEVEPDFDIKAEFAEI